MSIKIITAPSEVITAAEAAEFLRIDNVDDEETTINAFIKAARQWCEEYLCRAIGVQTIEVILDSFPSRGIFLRSPVISVTSVKYMDTSNVEQTLVENTDFYVGEDGEPCLIKPVSGWPDTLSIPDAVRVRYEAGYQPSGTSPSESQDLPETIKTAMLMLISDMYENREAQSDKVLNINPTVERLLSMYRLEMGI
jgi:uncharacterized phiE125 gp8 family phage protein